MITPIPYIGTGGLSQTALGHYGVGLTSGAIAATPTALDVHSSMRWAPSIPALLVLTRLKLGWAVITAISAAVRMTYQATIARQFTSDFATAATALNMATVAKTNVMRSGFMQNSQMGANGPRICTTAPQTTVTYTLDTAPFAIMTWPVPGPVTGAAGTVPGQSGSVVPIYEFAGQGSHPLILGNNEGVAVQLLHTGWASGTVNLYAQYEWAEVLVF